MKHPSYENQQKSKHSQTYDGKKQIGKPKNNIKDKKNQQTPKNFDEGQQWSGIDLMKISRRKNCTTPKNVSRKDPPTKRLHVQTTPKNDQSNYYNNYNQQFNSYGDQVPPQYSNDQPSQTQQDFPNGAPLNDFSNGRGSTA
jgi:hypothetical protein